MFQAPDSYSELPTSYYHAINLAILKTSHSWIAKIIFHEGNNDVTFNQENNSQAEAVSRHV